MFTRVAKSLERGGHAHTQTHIHTSTISPTHAHTHTLTHPGHMVIVGIEPYELVLDGKDAQDVIEIPTTLKPRNIINP